MKPSDGWVHAITGRLVLGRQFINIWGRSERKFTSTTNQGAYFIDPWVLQKIWWMAQVTHAT